MPKTLEIEFKNLLTKSEYQTLLYFFNGTISNRLKQTNYYFDTSSFLLKSHGCALRIRETDALIEWTMKIKQTQGNLEITDYLSRFELNQLIQEQILPKGEVLLAIEALSIHEPIRLITQLVTYRFETTYQNQLIMLDESHYSNQIDYEIELETEDYESGELIFKKLLNDFQIPIRKTIHKITRAVHALNKKDEA